MVPAIPLFLASLVTLSFASASTPNLRKRQHLSQRRANIVGRAPGDVNSTTLTASPTSAYALPDPQTLGVSRTGTALVTGPTSTGTLSTVQAIQAAFVKSSPLYPVAIGVAALIGVVALLLFIAITKAIAHRARFRDKKEYNENVAAPAASPSRPGSSTDSLVDKQEKVVPSVARSTSSSSSSSVTSRRTSFSSDTSSHYDPRDSSKDLVNFPSSKSSHSASSKTAPCITSYMIKIDPRRPSLPSTLRPATLSSASSVHRVAHTPSIRRPSLHLGAQPSSPPTPTTPVPRLPNLHTRFALPDEPVSPRSIAHSSSSLPAYAFPPSSPNSNFSFPLPSPNSTVPSPTSPFFSQPTSSPLSKLPPPPSFRLAPRSRPLAVPPSPATLPSPVLPHATLPLPRPSQYFFPKPLLLRKKSDAAPYGDWKGPIESGAGGGGWGVVLALVTQRSSI